MASENLNPVRSFRPLVIQKQTFTFYLVQNNSYSLPENTPCLWGSAIPFQLLFNVYCHQVASPRFPGCRGMLVSQMDTMRMTWRHRKKRPNQNTKSRIDHNDHNSHNSAFDVKLDLKASISVRPFSHHIARNTSCQLRPLASSPVNSCSYRSSTLSDSSKM